MNEIFGMTDTVIDKFLEERELDKFNSYKKKPKTVFVGKFTVNELRDFAKFLENYEPKMTVEYLGIIYSDWKNWKSRNGWNEQNRYGALEK